jgi:hypothetical protein
MSLGRSRLLGRNSLRENSWHLRKLRNNVRIMRKTPPALDTLFPSVRQGVLAATLTRLEKWWYLSELAEFRHTRPSSLQRELSWLEQSGILQQRKDGHRTYSKAETRSPIFGNQSDCLFEDAPQFPEEHSGLPRFAGERRFEGLMRDWGLNWGLRSVSCSNLQRLRCHPCACKLSWISFSVELIIRRANRFFMAKRRRLEEVVIGPFHAGTDNRDALSDENC